jgi:hypothetical protein
LPRQVRRRRAREGGAELGVVDAREGAREVLRQLAGRRDRPGEATLGRPVDRRQCADAEAQLADGDPAVLEARADVVGQERELVRPDARGDAQPEDLVLERERLRPLGDARAHRGPPDGEGDRLPLA